MLKQLPLFCALLAVLLGPLLLRPHSDRAARPGERELVIITPDNEAIREEFARAFVADHLQHTGEHLRIDWRTPGGTSDIVRYLDSEFLASFQNYWTRSLHRPWSSLAERSFADPRLQPAASPQADSPAQQARRAFLESNAGCGIDLFFGGGSFDFARQAAAGTLVDSGFVSAHPELFQEKAIPRELSGEPVWDAQGRWMGVCLSAFGICYNTDALARLRIAQAPHRWADLTDVRYLHELALANPTQSASVNRAFELLIQQQMIAAVDRRKAAAGTDRLSPEAEASALREGWARALQMLMKIGANSRYFTDSSSKIALDVAAGEGAAGLTIDFYGRFESEAVTRPGGASRLQFVNAEGGTSFSADTIGLLRGAPHPELAREFIAWTLSPAGQKLWNWRAATPGGPERYALRRLPVLRSLYTPEFQSFRSDPEVDPYASSNTFVYRAAWTGPLFKSIAFSIRVMCIDPHDELTAAWQALIKAHFPPKATQAFLNIEAVSYDNAKGRIREVFTRDKIYEVQLAKELTESFRAQYRQAAELARHGE